MSTADFIVAVLFLVFALAFLVGGFLWVTGLWAETAVAFVELFHRKRKD